METSNNNHGNGRFIQPNSNFSAGRKLLRQLTEEHVSPSKLYAIVIGKYPDSIKEVALRNPGMPKTVLHMIVDRHENERLTNLAEKLLKEHRMNYMR